MTRTHTPKPQRGNQIIAGGGANKRNHRVMSPKQIEPHSGGRYSRHRYAVPTFMVSFIPRFGALTVGYDLFRPSAF